MRPEDILEMLRVQPFEPFRVYLSDGAVYEIRHPDMAIAQRSKVTVGVPGPTGADMPAERTVNCALIHITRTELLNEAGNAFFTASPFTRVLLLLPRSRRWISPW